jgi:hypothetical protein
VKQHDVGLVAHAGGHAKIVDLAAFRRGRSVDNWFLAVSVLGFCVLSGLFAAKVSPLLGAGGLSAIIEWVK